MLRICDTYLTKAAFVKQDKRGRAAEATHWNALWSICAWQPDVSFLSLRNTQQICWSTIHFSLLYTLTVVLRITLKMKNLLKTTLRKKLMLHEGFEVKREADSDLNRVYDFILKWLCVCFLAERQISLDT